VTRTLGKKLLAENEAGGEASMWKVKKKNENFKGDEIAPFETNHKKPPVQLVFRLYNRPRGGGRDSMGPGKEEVHRERG